MKDQKLVDLLRAEANCHVGRGLRATADHLEILSLQFLLHTAADALTSPTEIDKLKADGQVLRTGLARIRDDLYVTWHARLLAAEILESIK